MTNTQVIKEISNIGNTALVSSANLKAISIALYHSKEEDDPWDIVMSISCAVGQIAKDIEEMYNKTIDMEFDIQKGEKDE